MKFPQDALSFANWAMAFIAGIFALAYAGPGLKITGAAIVYSSLAIVLLMGWGFVFYKIVDRCGGDPTQNSLGVWVFVSFALLLGLVAAGFHYR